MPSSTSLDRHALPYVFQNKRLSSEQVKEYNQRGFGAGGLPPLTFSHLKRNWSQINTSGVAEDDGMEFGLNTGEVDGVEWGPTSMEQGQRGYGPGMGLGAGIFPRVDVESPASWEREAGGVRREGRSVEEVVKEKGVLAVKRPRLGSKSGARGRLLQVPSSQVQRHSGGKGYQRFRTKKALEGLYGITVWVIEQCAVCVGCSLLLHILFLLSC